MKVSVIVPVYNAEKYLRDCLKSLVNQTLDEIEIIAIDDASSDTSLDILREYEKKYPTKIKVLSNKKNLGQGATRNIGVSHATGRYITFVDSDDYVSYDMYASLYEDAKKNSFPEVITTRLIFVKDSSYLDDNFQEISRGHSFIFKPSENPQFILEDSPSVCNKLFRSDTIKSKLFLEQVMWEDVAFSYAKMFNANTVLRSSAINYFYRKRNNEGVSSKGFKPNPNISDIFKVADKLENEVAETGRFELFESQIRFIQISACLQRITEIMSWQIPGYAKEKLCLIINSIIETKYGDWRKIPIEQLSSKVGYNELDKLQNLIQANQTETSIDLLQDELNNITKM